MQRKHRKEKTKLDPPRKLSFNLEETVILLLCILKLLTNIVD